MSDFVIASDISYLRNSIENNFLTIEDDEISSFGSNNNTNGIFNEYKKVVFRSLITSFGLDMLLFDDRVGGNIQTVHNFKNGVYVNKTFKERGDSVYERDKIAPNSILSQKRNEDFKSKERIIDGYTGKELPKDGRAEVDHIVSAKETHDTADTRAFFSDDEMKVLINDDRNLTYTEKRINRSKSDKSLSEFLDSQANGENQKNAERFDVDRKMATTADKSARNYINKETAKKKFEYYSKAIPKDCIKQGYTMAIRKGLGIIFTEVSFVIFEEVPKIVKELKGKFSLEKFLTKVADTIKLAFSKVKEKFKHIVTAIGDGFVAGIMTSLLTAIINFFFTTAKNIVRIIRQGIVSIKEAVTILVLNPDKYSPREKIKAASKVIFTGVSIIAGYLINEVVSKFLSASPLMAIPVIGNELVAGCSLFISTLCSGLLSVSFLYFIDNSPIAAKIIDFLANATYDKLHKDLVYNNEVLDKYICKLMEYDLAEYEKNALEFMAFNSALEKNQNDSSVCYEFLKKRGMKLQFENFEEFDKCMMDDDFVLVI